MKKVLAMTSIRSDYNLVRDLYRLLHEDQDIDFRVLASGAHMSETYGHSIKQIESDGFSILAKIETLIDSDSRASRIKTASILMQCSIDVIAQFDPHLIVYQGDREDVLVGASIGAYLEIPTMHLFGGDHTKDGHVDNPIRHAASKLSTIHVVSTSRHQDRLERIGEPSNRIFNTGSVALDKFVKHKAIPRDQILTELGVSKQFSDYAIVIFHPIAEERTNAHNILKNILESLRESNVCGLVSYPNTDPGNRALIEVIESFKNQEDFFFYKNLESNIFMSALKSCRFIIGNSSAGILESASIPIPAINVGLRQTGRDAGSNVIWTGTTKNDLRSAIETATSETFLDAMAKQKNIYGDGESSKRVYQLIKNNDFKPLLLKKEDPLEF